MKDKIEKDIKETRQHPDGMKPMVIGPTAPGKSSKYITKYISGIKKNTTDSVVVGTEARNVEE